MSLRVLEIYVLMMNKVHCNLIYAMKLFSSGYCVGMGFAGIAQLHKNAVLAIVCCLLGMNMAAIYSLVYQKGFRVQAMFVKVVKAMLKSLKGEKCNVEGSGKKESGSQAQAVFVKVVKGMPESSRCNKRDAEGPFSSIVERQLKSVPSMGIKVGSFHTLERTSTPAFLGLVVSNVVCMLVMYR